MEPYQVLFQWELAVKQKAMEHCRWNEQQTTVIQNEEEWGCRSHKHVKCTYWVFSAAKENAFPQPSVTDDSGTNYIYGTCEQSLA